MPIALREVGEPGPVAQVFTRRFLNVGPLGVLRRYCHPHFVRYVLYALASNLGPFLWLHYNSSDDVCVSLKCNNINQRD